MIEDVYGNPYALPGPFRTMLELRDEYERRGSYFFSRDTRRFFSSRISEDIYAGCMFVESVKPPHAPRRYRVMIASDGRGINQVGPTFDTLREAKRHASGLCKREGMETWALVGTAAEVQDARERWGSLPDLDAARWRRDHGAAS